MSGDLQAVWLTALLAATTALLLVPLASPLAWWLARSTSSSRSVIEAVVAMPLVLPPTVLGFYLLIMLNPESAVGSLWVELTGDSLTFSFSGLVDHLFPAIHGATSPGRLSGRAGIGARSCGDAGRLPPRPVAERRAAYGEKGISHRGCADLCPYSG